MATRKGPRREKFTIPFTIPKGKRPPLPEHLPPNCRKNCSTCAADAAPKSDCGLPSLEDLFQYLKFFDQLAPALEALTDKIAAPITRDRFAAASIVGVMPGLLSNQVTVKEAAQTAYEVADAMMAARKAVARG